MTGIARALAIGCLVPAVGLTVLRVIQPELGLAVRLVSFAPLAVIPYAVVLLVSTARALRPRRGRWQVHAAVAVVALTGIGLHGWWLSPQFTGPNPPATTGAEPLRVLTVNLLRGEADGPGVVARAATQQVDVLVVEEVTPGVLERMREAGLEQLFPHHAGAPRSGVDGTMVFATGEITEVSRLATGFDSWAVTISLAQGDLRLFAVHPHPPTGTAQGWRADLATIASAVADQQPDVVSGDFNATDDHAPFRAVLDEGLRDTAERVDAGWQPTWPANGKLTVLGIPLPRLVQIDHVLIGPRLTTLAVRDVAVEDTDHAGVLAEVALR